MIFHVGAGLGFILQLRDFPWAVEGILPIVQITELILSLLYLTAGSPEITAPDVQPRYESFHLAAGLSRLFVSVLQYFSIAHAWRL